MEKFFKRIGKSLLPIFFTLYSTFAFANPAPPKLNGDDLNLKLPKKSNQQLKIKKTPFEQLPEEFRNKIKNYRTNYAVKQEYLIVDGRGLWWTVLYEVDHPYNGWDLEEWYLVDSYKLKFKLDGTKKADILLYKYDDNKPPEPRWYKYDVNRDGNFSLNETLSDENMDGISNDPLKANEEWLGQVPKGREI